MSDITKEFNLAFIQTGLAWEDKQANLTHFEALIDELHEDVDLIVLPEMFNSGFSMNVDFLAEPWISDTLTWMVNMATAKNCAITGSFIVNEDGRFYNRLSYVFDASQIAAYDKRHLFSLGKEQDYFSPGNEKLVVDHAGWKICPQICYDLRFPAWNRNEAEDPYDLLIFVANWPEKRIDAWRKLLVARAIENQSYVLGLNRIGKDGNELDYSGDSLLVDPLGEIMVDAGSEDKLYVEKLKRKHLSEIREKLPFLNDADEFIIKE